MVSFSFYEVVLNHSFESSESYTIVAPYTSTEQAHSDLLHENRQIHVVHHTATLTQHRVGRLQI